MKIAVQLYTLRTLMEQDLWGTLARLADAGFRSVELAGLCDQSPGEWRKRLDGLGLQAVAMHVGLPEAEGEPSRLIETARALGLEHVVCPWIDESVRSMGWPAIGARLAAAGQAFTESDLSFGYHNHDFELVKVGAKTGLETLFDHASSVHLCAELDVCWVHLGGSDPGQMLMALAGRTPLAHFKDADADGKFTEVGSGVLDWDDIIEASETAGVEYAVIENDLPQMDPIDSVKISREFLLAQGLKD